MTKVAGWIAQSYARQECEALRGRMQGQCMEISIAPCWKERRSNQMSTLVDVLSRPENYFYRQSTAQNLSLGQLYPNLPSCNFVTIGCIHEALHVMLIPQAQVHSIESFVLNDQVVAFENSFLHSWSPRLSYHTAFQLVSGACQACKQKLPFQEIKSSPNLSTNTAILTFSASCSSRVL